MLNVNAPGTVVIFSASIGAGHDGAARELARRLGERGIPSVRHDFLDKLPAGLGQTLRDTYARQLRTVPESWGWLLDKMAGPRLSAGAGALSAGLTTTRMLAAIGPDTSSVVSTYPLASQVLGRLRRSGRLATPVAAVMTDPSVHPLCVARGVDVHLAPGQHTADQIHALNAPVLTVSPIVGPEFRPAADRAERDAIRRRLGLPVDERLAVVIAGSWGVGDVETTAADIARTGAAVPVVVCGRNEALRRNLNNGTASARHDDRTPTTPHGGGGTTIGRHDNRIPTARLDDGTAIGLHGDGTTIGLHDSGTAIALGWVDDMPSLLRAADVAIHNAGGLSSVEAMASGLPVISYRCLPGHGTANARILAAAGLSPWPDGVDELAVALRAAVSGDALAGRQRALATACHAPDAAELIAAQHGTTQHRTVHPRVAVPSLVGGQMTYR